MPLPRWLKKIILVGIVLLVPGGVICAASAMAETRYTAGVDRLPRTVLTPEIWLFYPALAAPETAVFGAWKLNAAKAVPVAPGRHPAIVISHGLYGRPLNHHLLAQALAEAGFVVIAPLHDDGPAVAQRYTRRTRDISIALDAVLLKPRFAAHIDKERIGAFGFSLGGASVLAAAGGRIDYDRLRAHCRLAGMDPIFCADGRIGAIPGPVPLFPDPRLRSIVLAAPHGVMFSQLEAVTADIWLIRAGQDRQLRFPFHAEWIRGLIGGPYRYSFEPAAHHFAFLSPFPENILDQVGPAARDPAGFDRMTFQGRMNREITSHFKATLGP